MIEDTSLEFDMFEDARRKLVRVLVSEGHERLDAEKIALYVVQGIREMPKLLMVLGEPSSHTHAEILIILRALLDNSCALDRARGLLLGIESEDQTTPA